ncbi:MAG: glycosyltransferase family 4 protein [Opitutales bacterium]|tara:strand:- start:101 stop:1735 length:1635 start_codon:yes stop_codon:yes gene_type:complete
MSRLGFCVLSGLKFVDRITGLLVNNEAFVKAILKYGSFEEYHIFLPEANYLLFEKEFGEYLEVLDPKPNITLVNLFELPYYFQNYTYDAFHCGDPHIEVFTELRDILAKEPFPVTGITHSLDRKTTMSGLNPFNLQDVQPYDGLICSSKAALEAVSNIFDERDALHAERLHLKEPIKRPVLEHIPLGVDDPLEEWIKKTATIEDADFASPVDGVVVLSLGRVCAYSKMDYVPLVEVFKEVVGTPGCENAKLIIAGAARMEDVYIKILSQRVHDLGLDQRVFFNLNFPETAKGAVYSAADIFVSLPDHVQESFGIAPVEAMRAGVPPVLADWSGYGELFEEGVSGYGVPTYWGDCDAMTEYTTTVMLRKALLYLAQSVAFDRAVLRDRLVELIKNEPLRKKMGEAAKARAESRYAWPVVVKHYESFWKQLKCNALRDGLSAGVRRTCVLPYYDVFYHYTKTHLKATTRVSITARGKRVRKEEETIYVYPTVTEWIDGKVVFDILELIDESCSVEHLFEGVDVANKVVLYHVLWLIKHGYLEVETV